MDATQKLVSLRYKVHHIPGKGAFTQALRPYHRNQSSILDHEQFEEPVGLDSIGLQLKAFEVLRIIRNVNFNWIFYIG